MIRVTIWAHTATSPAKYELAPSCGRPALSGRGSPRARVTTGMATTTYDTTIATADTTVGTDLVLQVVQRQAHVVFGDAGLEYRLQANPPDRVTKAREGSISRRRYLECGVHEGQLNVVLEHLRHDAGYDPLGEHGNIHRVGVAVVLSVHPPTHHRP